MDVENAAIRLGIVQFILLCMELLATSFVHGCWSPCKGSGSSVKNDVPTGCWFSSDHLKNVYNICETYKVSEFNVESDRSFISVIEYRQNFTTSAIGAC